MNYLAGCVFALVFVCCAFAQDFSTIALPLQECPDIPSNKHFHEREITHHWRATHYFFKGDLPAIVNQTTCGTLDISSVPEGIKTFSKSDYLGTTYNETAVLNRTETAGIYKTGQGVHTAKNVFFLHHGYLLVEVCVNTDTVSLEAVAIYSKRHGTPNAVLGAFKHHLNSHGLHVDRFHKFDNSHCHH